MYISLGGPIRRSGQRRCFARSPSQGFCCGACQPSAAAPGATTIAAKRTTAVSRAFTHGSLSLYPDPLLSSAQAMADLPENFQTAPLTEVDPEIATVLERELR